MLSAAGSATPLGAGGPTIPSGAPCRWANDSERTAGVSPPTRCACWQASAIPQILSLIDVTHHCTVSILQIKNVIWFFANSAKENHRPKLSADRPTAPCFGSMGQKPRSAIWASSAPSAGLSASFRCLAIYERSSGHLAITQPIPARSVI